MENKRLTLEDFRNEISLDQDTNLDELTGGILGACHTPPRTLQDSIHDFLDDLFDGGLT